MNLTPTILKLFVATVCTLFLFMAAVSNKTEVIEKTNITNVTYDVVLTRAPTSATTTLVKNEKVWQIAIPFLEEGWSARADRHEEAKIVEEPPTTTTTTTTTTIAIVQNSPTSDRWGVVSEEAMDVYEKEQTWLSDTFDYSDIPFLIDNLYGFWEKGTHIVDLQRMLGMDYVDGIYGPSTRRKHMEWFGSFEAAQRYFFDRETWYLETVRSSPETEAGWKHNWNDWDSPPTLEQLVDIYFEPVDKEWALRVAFCESSALPHHTYSNAVSSALAVGWFQHLSKYWLQRAKISGWEGYDIFDSEPNVAVAAWLFYETGGAEKHWNPSRSCWKDTPHGQ